jgi:sugar lactone lactonase YvrE
MCSLSPASLSRPKHRLSPSLSRSAASAAVLLSLGVIGCGDDDDGGTSALADSGSLAAITANDIDIPTTVTVSQGVVWVVESQFTNFEPFGGMGEPLPFRLLGYPLQPDQPREFIALPDAFFPEGIASNPEDGRLYVGSVSTGAIYTVGPNVFDAVPFISPTNLPMGTSTFGMSVSSDEDHSMLWACMSANGQVFVSGFDIATATSVVVHRLTPYSEEVPAFCNDVIQSPNGALWITESMGGRLYRVAPEDVMTDNSANVWLEADNLAGPDGPANGSFGANGLTLAGGQLFIANSARGSLWRIDPTLSEPTNDDLRLVQLSEDGNDNVTLAGPDGIHAINSSQILIVENGFGLEGGKRVVLATLGGE